MAVEDPNQAAQPEEGDDPETAVRELERDHARLQALLHDYEGAAARHQAARVEFEAARTRLALLAEISQFLLASLDYQAAINGLARMILPALGDACFVDIEEHDLGRRVAIAHINPHKAALLRRFDEATGLTTLLGRAFATALRTGKPERGDGSTENGYPDAVQDAPASAILAEIGLRAFMVIPLVTRGRVLGAMVFLVTESERKYGADDLDFGQHVARRAATAVDNLRLYEEALQARQAAEDANRLKDEFLATLSHELRTPLNAILGWARMLRAGRLDPAARDKALVTIERNALAQAQIVEDLLDVSRVIRGSLRLKLENVDLRAVIDAALATVRPAVEAKGIVLGVHLEALGLIVGDAGRLQQVVWNLVSNATKFTPTGGRIDVYLKRHDAEIELRVRDTGAGISPRFLPHVFERFRQGDSTATRSFGGLGLGLSIVRHLVELHGGTVEADSAGSGQGATFTVRLPLRVPEVAWQPPPAVAEDPVPSGEGALAGVDVLVVDDEPDARELVATILRQQGAAVRTVASAQAARDSLAHFRPRVLIADVAMPGEDGYTLIRGLRNDCVDLPAVALTAYARPEDRRRALDAGFEMHLSKPVEPDELVGVVAELSGRRA